MALRFALIVWSAIKRRHAARRWAAITSFYSLRPEQFEEHVAETFRYLGYSTTLTPRVGDQGVDVIAARGPETVAVQCKRYSDPAPNTAVQAVHAGAAYYGCNRAIVVCLGGFSRSARDLAQQTSVELIDGNGYADMVHRIAPAEISTSRLLPSARTALAAVALIAAGALAIIVDVVRSPASNFTMPAANARQVNFMVVLFAMLLITIGLRSLRRKRR